METTLTRPSALVTAAERAAGISREEFDAIVRAHQQRIYRVLVGLVRDTDAADTLTQECFLRAYQNRKGFRGESSIGTWLVRIAINLATDHARNRRTAFWRRLFGGADADATAHAASALLYPGPSPERQLAVREELRAVWSAVESLPPQQRAAFVLRFAEQLTLAEVAEAMALEVGTVKAHLARALGAVRKRFKEKSIHARPSDR